MANSWRLVDEKTTNRQIAGMVLFDIKPNLGRKCQKMTGLRRSSSFNVNGDFLKGGRGLTGLVVCHAHLTNNFLDIAKIKRLETRLTTALDNFIAFKKFSHFLRCQIPRRTNRSYEKNFFNLNLNF